PAQAGCRRADSRKPIVDVESQRRPHGWRGGNTRRRAAMMKVIASHPSLGEITDGVLIVPVFEGQTPLDAQPGQALSSLDHLTRGMLEAVFQSGEMSGKRDRWTLLHTAPNLATSRILLYGAGKREAATPLALQRLAGAAARLLDARGVRSA